MNNKIIHLIIIVTAFLFSSCSSSWDDKYANTSFRSVSTSNTDNTINGTLIAEIDWTRELQYYDDMWYSDEWATISVVKGEGLVIDSNPIEGANIWEPQVPMIAHLPNISAGEHYVVKFTLDAPATGEIRLDFCSSDGTGATKDWWGDVVAGEKEYTVDFPDYPISCTDAFIFYQCGYMPGRHVIKKVQVYDMGKTPTLEPEPEPEPASGTILAEIDWTERSEYLDLWYSDDFATVTVKQGTGLIIDCTSDGTTEYWEPQVPMIGHLPDIKKGGQYLVKFTLDAPATGEIRLDFCSWDGSSATKDAVFQVEAGVKDYTIEFPDYPTPCSDAMIFYQCGKIPGKHVIKKVQVINSD